MPDYNVDPYSASLVLSIDGNTNGMILGAANYAIKNNPNELFRNLPL